MNITQPLCGWVLVCTEGLVVGADAYIRPWVDVGIDPYNQCLRVGI